MQCILRLATYTWQREAFAPAAVLVLIIIGMAMDVFSMVRAMIRSRHQRGSSGFGPVPWVIYVVAVLFGRDPVFANGIPFLCAKAVDFAVLTSVYVLCQHVLPSWHVRWLSKQRRTPM